MKRMVELDLDHSTWEVIEERARKAFEEIKAELDECGGEEYTMEDAIKTELTYIIEKDVELFDVYDGVRNSPSVKHAVLQEIKKVTNHQAGE